MRVQSIGESARYEYASIVQYIKLVQSEKYS